MSGATLLQAAPPASSPVETTGVSETKAQRDARMAWWRDAQFGLFIHWGVYSVPAGIYKGERVKDYAEKIMRGAKIPIAEYRLYAKDFNPVKFDADGIKK